MKELQPKELSIKPSTSSLKPRASSVRGRQKTEQLQDLRECHVSTCSLQKEGIFDGEEGSKFFSQENCVGDGEASFATMEGDKGNSCDDFDGQQIDEAGNDLHGVAKDDGEPQDREETFKNSAYSHQTEYSIQNTQLMNADSFLGQRPEMRYKRQMRQMTKSSLTKMPQRNVPKSIQTAAKMKEVEFSTV